MKVTITGRHLDVEASAREHIQRKVKPLERLMGESAVSAQCVLWRERGLIVCELTVRARQDHTLIGLGRHAQLPRAVSVAVGKVGQQAQRLKDRWKTRRRIDSGAPSRASGPTSSRTSSRNDAIVEPQPRVIRARPSEVKPMSLDDAMLTLGSGVRQFLVFRDAASDGVTVLYRRPDGHFGLIEPEA